MRVEVLQGEALAGAIDDVAGLRLSVFAQWPYLYAGDMEYERRYLAPYLTSDEAILVGAFDGATLVGAATGMPIEDHEDDFAACLPDDLAQRDVFYCAESVLLPAYRGRGLGHAFFDHREAHGRALGDTHAAFCAVQRPESHPARPKNARSHGQFWSKRGYRPVAGAFATFRWTDIGDAADSEKKLQLWMKPL